MLRYNFILVKIFTTFFTMMCCVTAFGQYTSPQAFNDTLPPVHDPVIIMQDSTYYIFCTGQGIAVLSSKNMKKRKQGKPVFDKSPRWALDAVTGFSGHIWALDVSYHDGSTICTIQ